jgi:hypothetical protein
LVSENNVFRRPDTRRVRVPEQAEQTLILTTRLRGIKEADPAEFFPKDLLGGQTLDNMHLPLAVGTLPNDGLIGGRCGGARRRRCTEQSSANRE